MILKPILIKIHWLLSSQFGLDPRLFLRTLRGLAPYHYCSGFSKYWYEYHLAQRGFHIEQLTANGDWYALLLQEITRLGLERQRGNWAWPLAYAYALLGVLYFKLRANKRAEDLACFGWQCVAVKR